MKVFDPLKTKTTWSKGLAIFWVLEFQIFVVASTVPEAVAVSVAVVELVVTVVVELAVVVVVPNHLVQLPMLPLRLTMKFLAQDWLEPGQPHLARQQPLDSLGPHRHRHSWSRVYRLRIQSPLQIQEIAANENEARSGCQTHFRMNVQGLLHFRRHRHHHGCFRHGSLQAKLGNACSWWTTAGLQTLETFGHELALEISGLPENQQQLCQQG